MALKRRVDYEWAVEWVDGHGGIQDTSYWAEDELPQAWALLNDHEMGTPRLALCKHVWETDGDAHQDEVERSYAYLRPNCILPNQLENGDFVPQRIRTLFANHIQKTEA